MEAFVTESGYDFLYVNDFGFSGSLQEVQMAGLDGLAPNGGSPDRAYELKGWKICQVQRNVTSFGENWTCTTEGTACQASVFTQGGEFSACTRMFSDELDADGDYNVHDGHPWCSTDSAPHAACGPCSCAAGERQTYETVALFDGVDPHTYITCSDCAPGSFKPVGGNGDDVSDECTPCPLGKFSGKMGSTACETCRAGSVSTTLGTSACHPCTPGSFNDRDAGFECQACSAGFTFVSGATSCEACAEGFFSEEAGPACSPCSAGFFGAEVAKSACERCAIGEFAANDAQTVCTSCHLGSIAEQRGLSACLGCEMWHYADNASKTSCAPCATGRFQNESGQSRCHLCSEVLDVGGRNVELWVTMHQVEWKVRLEWTNMVGASDVSMCGCGQGAWLSLSSECAECGEGMICNGMGVVELEAGYFARWDSAGFVWRCFGVDAGRCPGGPPGSCARNRLNTSVACGACERGTRETTGGACEVCSGSDVGWIVGASVLLFFMVSFVYFAVHTDNKAKRRGSAVFLTILCSQMFTVFQMMGIFDLISVSWPQPFATIVSIGSLLNFRLEVVNVGCVVSMTSLARYMLTAFGFVMTGVAVILIHCARVLVTRVQILDSKSALIGGLGATSMGFFISVSSFMFAPFECVRHPNGLQTVRAYPQSICWNSEFDEHRNMVFGAAFMSLFPFAFMALCLWVIFSLPGRINRGDTEFLHTFAFILYRFRPGASWYALVLLIRNLGVAIVLIVPVPVLELFILSTLLLPCLVLCAAFRPWAVYQANALDMATHGGFVLAGRIVHRQH